MEKYPGWGGSGVVLTHKFDFWWNERWKNLFGEETRYTDKYVLSQEMNFPLSTTQPKVGVLWIALLVWPLRDTSPDWQTGKDEAKRRGGNALAIARRIVSTERNKRASELYVA